MDPHAGPSREQASEPAESPPAAHLPIDHHRASGRRAPHDPFRHPATIRRTTPMATTERSRVGTSRSPKPERTRRRTELTACLCRSRSRSKPRRANQGARTAIEMSRHRTGQPPRPGMDRAPESNRSDAPQPTREGCANGCVGEIIGARQPLAASRSRKGGSCRPSWRWAGLGSPSSASPLAATATRGAGQTLKLCRALLDPILVGDEQPHRRASAPGAPDLTCALERARQPEHPSLPSSCETASAVGLLSLRAESSTSTFPVCRVDRGARPMRGHGCSSGYRIDSGLCHPGKRSPSISCPRLAPTTDHSPAAFTAGSLLARPSATVPHARTPSTQIGRRRRRPGFSFGPAEVQSSSRGPRSSVGDDAEARA
jgi:hypothetical protein